MLIAGYNNSRNSRAQCSVLSAGGGERERVRVVEEGKEVEELVLVRGLTASSYNSRTDPFYGSTRRRTAIGERNPAKTAADVRILQSSRLARQLQGLHSRI